MNKPTTHERTHNRLDAAERPNFRRRQIAAGLLALTTIRGGVALTRDVVNVAEDVSHAVKRAGASTADFISTHTRTEEQLKADFNRMKKESTEAPSRAINVTVRSGDTAWSISDRFIDNDEDKMHRLAAVLDAENPEPNLHPGEKLTVPEFLTNKTPDDN